MASISEGQELDAFEISNTSYTGFEHRYIPVSVLFPKHGQRGKYPVMVRWHGGGFTTGQRLFAEWIGDWILNLALRENAILVTPDYRLMPEATGLDILADVHSLFTWLLDPDNLEACLPNDVIPDRESILVSGESAGGWLALQSAFHRSEHVKAVIAHYPMIDLKDRWYTEDYEKQIFVPPIPQLDRSILNDFVAGLKGGESVTSAIPPARSQLFASMLQQGSFGKFFGDDERLYPLEMLDKADAGRIPPTWILHGNSDTVIPVAGTQKYAQELESKHPDAKLHLSYRDGDHGFDNESTTLEDDWVKEGLAFIGQYWPKR